MSVRKAILRNSAINAVGKAFNYAVQLLLISYLVRNIGGTAYGVFVIALALIGNSNLLEAGFGLSVTKYTAEYKAKGDAEGLACMVNTGFLVNTCLAVVFSGLILAVAFFFVGFFFKVPADQLPQVRTLLLMLLALSFFEFWTVGFIRVAEGLQNYKLARNLENLKWAMRLVFAAVIFRFRCDLLAAGAAYLLSGVVSFFVLLYYTYGARTGIPFDLSRCSRSAFGKMLRFSVWILISKLSSLFFYRINSILIGVFLEPVYATYYTIGSKLYELLKYGFGILSSTLVPVSAELAAKADIARLSKLFEKSAYYTVLLMAPFVAFTALRADVLIRLWMGPGFGPAVPLARLLVLSLVPTLFVASGTEMLVGLNRMRYLVIYSVLGAAVSFTISLLLIRHIGIDAVAFGAIAGALVTSAGYVHLMSGLFNTFSSGGDFLRASAKLVFSIIVLTVVLWFSKGLVLSCSVLLLYFIVAYRYLVDAPERDYVSSIYKKRIGLSF